jgi:hypothetical protein
MATIEAVGDYSQACIDAFELLDLSEAVLDRIRSARTREKVFEPFVPIGEVALGGDDMLVHAGVKNRGFSSVKRVAEEMYVGDLLLAHKAALVEALPMFTLPISDGDRDSGILTEDFTQTGNVRLDERRENFPIIGRVHRFDVPEGLYRDVYDALDGKVYREAFRHMMGWVGHREVMVDFNDIGHPSTSTIETYSEIAHKLLIDI